jgi:orotidine-5'-phosphate decarboxylase
MQAYADAYLDPRSALAVDALTVSPYLGMGALAPAFDTAHRHRAGVFVLARTSNPEGRAFQEARCGDGRHVADVVTDEVRNRNADEAPWGSIGVVVGATLGVRTPADVGGPVLAPGVGAQGAAVADLPAIFGESAPAVYPVSARGVLAAGPGVRALRAAAEALNDECAAILS